MRGVDAGMSRGSDYDRRRISPRTLVTRQSQSKTPLMTSFRTVSNFSLCRSRTSLSVCGLAVFFTISAMSARPGAAQDNLFGDLNPAADTGVVVEDDPKAPEPDVELLMVRANRGTIVLADSISSLARIDNWPEVEALLSQATQQNLDATQLALMAEQIEPSVMLKIATHPGLSPAGSDLVAKMMAAAKASLADPAKLRAAIAAVNSGTVDQQLQAYRTLLSGGNDSIVEIVAAVVASDDTDANGTLLALLAKFGSGGSKALRQLALYGMPEQRRRALTGLTQMDVRNSAAELLTAYHAADASDAERAVAADAMRRVFSGVVDLQDALTYLIKDLRAKSSFAQGQPNVDDSVWLWSVTPQRTGVQYVRSRSLIEAYRNATDAGSRLRRIAVSDEQISQDILAADLSYRLIADPLWGNETQLAEFKAASGDLLSGERLLNTLSMAIRSDSPLTTVGILRSISADASDAERQAMLYQVHAGPSALVEATSAPEPAIRYEAAAAILRLNPDRPYAGENRVQRCLAEMRTLSDKPVVAIVETRPELVQYWQSVLGPMGYQTRVVQTVGRLERLVAAGNDLRLIVSKTQLWDLSPLELVDRIRRSSFGRNVPIMFYGDDANYATVRRWDGLVRLIDEPLQGATLRSLLERISDQRWAGELVDKKTGEANIVIVVETDPSVSDQIASDLQTAGYKSRFVSSVEGLMSAIDDYPYAHMIMSPVNGPAGASGRLVSVVRRSVAGESIPITFYGAGVSAVDTRQAPGINVLFDRQPLPAGLIEMFNAVESQRRMPAMTGADRGYFRRLAEAAN